jgi:hypothetical protein
MICDAMDRPSHNNKASNLGPYDKGNNVDLTTLYQLDMIVMS